jgi:hypothetical protein
MALGPQVSFANSKREYVHPTSEDPGGPSEETLDTNYSSLAPVTAGYVVGAGYRWATGKAAGLRVELRYSGDFTQVYRAGYGAGSLCPGGSNQFRNSVIQVQVSGLFSRDEPVAPTPVPAPVPATPQPPYGHRAPLSSPCPGRCHRRPRLDLPLGAARFSRRARALTAPPYQTLLKLLH